MYVGTTCPFVTKIFVTLPILTTYKAEKGDLANVFNETTYSDKQFVGTSVLTKFLFAETIYSDEQFI